MRPRGLCWKCYYTPGILDRYPISSSIFAYRSPVKRGVKYGEPTDALPGTPEKVAVLEKRAQNGEHLFHPDDAKLEDE